MHKEKLPTLGIIGCGPRGLAALELFVANVVLKNDSASFEVVIFEKAKHPGAGQVWMIEQPNANWLNIDNESLKALKGRKELIHKKFIIPEFPGFTDWQSKSEKTHDESDHKYIFHYRSTMGEYLYQRFNSIFQILYQHNFVRLFTSKIIDLKQKNTQIIIVDQSNREYKVDECLLTIGHQPTRLSNEIKDWKDMAKLHNIQLELDPYDLELKKRIHSGSKIAIRGFGLATIDLIRLFISEENGVFSKNSDDIFLTYTSKRNKDKEIVVFSLDGLPPVPKPIGIIVDSTFDPGKEVIRKFEDDIISLLKKSEQITSSLFLVELVADIVSDIFFKKPNHFYSHSLDRQQIKKLVIAWLQDMNIKHTLILNISQDRKEYMRCTAKMAYGISTASLDYTIGQIWRHLQPSMYKTLSHSGLSDSIIQEIIELDESTKRYSYGPPVDSILQLIALADQGALNLDFTEDPSIQVDSAGWTLVNERGDSVSTEVMINSVLDSPSLEKINSDLVKNLLENDLLKPITSDLGVDTYENGIVKYANKDEKTHISMLGRNCKGSVIGVDAILECFGLRIEKWATACSSRMFDNA